VLFCEDGAYYFVLLHLAALRLWHRYKFSPASRPWLANEWFFGQDPQNAEHCVRIHNASDFL
jgi:hypothetical protein